MISYIRANPFIFINFKRYLPVAEGIFLFTSKSDGVKQQNNVQFYSRQMIRIYLVIAVSLLFFPISSHRVTESSVVASEAGETGAAVSVERPEELHKDDFRSVRKYAVQYKVDYRLILSIMEHESRYNRLAVSPMGARGILQIMPATGRELSSELNMPDIAHPSRHLRAGIYYYSKLFDLFRSAPPEQRRRLALAAYNAGPSRIYDAQELAAYLGENPDDWDAIRHILPLLSRRYSSLHAHVWGEARPPHGYFSGWKETVRYVDRVMSSYTRYTSPAG